MPTMTSTPEPMRPERILVVGNGFLGDTVLGIPFFRNLRRRFPEAVIDVLIEPAAAAVLAHCPYKDELIAWPRPPRSRRLMPSTLAAIPTQARWLRSRGYTRAYLFKRSFSSAILVWLAGIPWRIGHASEGRGWLFSRAVPAVAGRHQAEAYLDLLRCEGIAVDDGHNENWVCEADRPPIDSLLAGLADGRPRVFLAVRSTNPSKHWPVERWAAVVEWLVKSRGCEVFLCGGPDDVVMHGEIKSLVPPGFAAHMHDYSAAVRLRQVGAFVDRMDLCIGVDSGLPHIAASHGVPVAVLFGPTDPRQWHPWQATSAIVRSSDPQGAMEGISVADVVAAAGRLLDQSVPRLPPPRREVVRSRAPQPMARLPVA